MVEQRQHYRLTEVAEDAPKGDYKALSVGPSGVSLATMERTSGVTKDGKRWSRSKARSSVVINLREYKDGRPMVNVYSSVSMARRSRQFFNVTPSVSDQYGPLCGEFGAVAIAKFLEVYRAKYGLAPEIPLPRAILELAYPMLRENKEWSYAAGLGSALRHVTARDFVETAFGITRYRKDLVKAIANSPSLEPVGWSAQMRGLIPVDWMVQAISEYRPRGIHHPQVRGLRDGYHSRANMRSLAQLVDENSRRRLLFTLAKGEVRTDIFRDTFLSLDTIRRANYEMPAIGRVGNWRDLHDLLATAARRSVNANRKISQDHKVYKALDGKTVGDLTIVSAKETDDLLDWGDAMSNCIGGYGSNATSGHSFLFGLYRGTELVGNMEVSSTGQVYQLVEKHNRQFTQYDEVAKFVHKQTGFKQAPRGARRIEYPRARAFNDDDEMGGFF